MSHNELVVWSLASIGECSWSHCHLGIIEWAGVTHSLHGVLFIPLGCLPFTTDIASTLDW